MNEKVRDFMFIIMLIVLSGVFGYVLAFLFPIQDVGGFWVNEVGAEKVKTIAYDFEPSGEWICVNIRGMSYKRAQEVINHEIGHSMFHEEFAEVCEKNWTKCNELLEEKDVN